MKKRNPSVIIIQPIVRLVSLPNMFLILFIDFLIPVTGYDICPKLIEGSQSIFSINTLDHGVESPFKSLRPSANVRGNCFANLTARWRQLAS